MIRVKYRWLIPALLVLAVGTGHGIGVNISAFLPTNGLLSHPVSPLSFRDVGFTLGKSVGISGGIALNNINGMGLLDSSGSPIQLSEPALGPFYTVTGSAMLKLILPVWRITFEPAGGIFGYYLINPTLRSGVIDSYIAVKSGYETVDSNFTVTNRLGWGWVVGGMISVSIADKIGAQLGAFYYRGSSPLELDGTFRADGSDVTNAVPSYLTGALLDYSGFEFIIGGTYEL